MVKSLVNCVLSLIVVASLVACGQKGPLTLPKTEDKKETTFGSL